MPKTKAAFRPPSALDARRRAKLLSILAASMQHDFEQLAAAEDDEEEVLSPAEREAFRRFVVETRLAWLSKLGTADLATAVLTDANAEFFFLA